MVEWESGMPLGATRSMARRVFKCDMPRILLSRQGARVSHSVCIVRQVLGRSHPRFVFVACNVLSIEDHLAVLKNKRWSTVLFVVVVDMCCAQQ